MGSTFINLAYLFASVLFILGLKGMGHPRKAARGNLMGALGMLIAVVVTLADKAVISYTAIGAGLIIGTVIGAGMARFVQMTDMPQMVALLNGFGGIGSTLVAGAAMLEARATIGHGLSTEFLTATAASGLIGSVTFWGSLVAFAKLHGVVVPGNAVTFPGQHALSALLGLATLGCAWMVIAHPETMLWYWLLALVASVLGVMLVIGIGGADMPVVVSLLNSYSGIAAAATGFVLLNNMLIVAGSLVGASGIILTSIMCKAMNRSLTNVLFGGFGAEGQTSIANADEVYAGKIKSTSPEEVAMLLEGARRVVFVPGYGMAVAQAQHAVKNLAAKLEKNGAEVEFAIHPVAGRMPGHMNVLLAEADVDYKQLKDMDESNPGFRQTDVAIVIGANDVVNPVANTDPKSPIAGMPILNVHEARTVLIIKRSLSPGFAGIPNPLFAADNALMLFADAKEAIQDITASLDEALAA